MNTSDPWLKNRVFFQKKGSHLAPFLFKMFLTQSKACSLPLSYPLAFHHY